MQGLGEERTLGDGAAVEGAGGGPAAADAVEGAVAEAPAGRALPGPGRLHLQNVLPVAHEEAVPAEDPLRRMLSPLLASASRVSQAVQCRVWGVLCAMHALYVPVHSVFEAL